MGGFGFLAGGRANAPGPEAEEDEDDEGAPPENFRGEAPDLWAGFFLFNLPA